IGLLGILKAGGTYFPIDPDYPQERIQFMLADANVKFLVNNDNNFGDSTFSEVLSVSSVSSVSSVVKKNHLHLPRRYAPATSLAYVIYTSGSTGRPKGVMIMHRGVVNVVTWFGRRYGLKPGVNLLQMSNYTFDASVNQIFGTLLFGATLHIIPKDLLLNMELLRRFIDENQIHIINFVPPLLNQLLSEGTGLKSLKAVISGGERLDDAIKNKIITRGYCLYNHYGPTETTIDALSSCCTKEIPVQLGQPIANTKVYILDKVGKLSPLGVVGELVVSGPGVARGYLNQPELTEDKFIELKVKVEEGEPPREQIPNKHMSYMSHKSYIYKTGDLARWLPDGNVEFLGRIDHQVKIRGFRIEPGEIESQLIMHNKIKEAAVILKEDKQKNHRYLCAYLVTEGELSVSNLRDYLSTVLPDYMIPSYFLQMEELPLTPNGKVDRRVLPEPEIKTGENIVAPRDEIEEKLVKIWGEVLGVDHPKIGIDDNFFELGGHSLKAAIVMSMIHKVFNIRMTLSQLFTHPTIRALSQSMNEAVTDRYMSIEPAEKKEYYPLSPAQKQLFILLKSEKDNMVYNIPWVMLLQGELEKERLQGTFRCLIERHESFRTSFKMVQGEPVQVIHHKVEFEIRYYHLATENTEDTEGTRGLDPLFIPTTRNTNTQLATSTIKNFIRPFELSKAPLLRVGLIKIPGSLTNGGATSTHHLLMIDMNHIISDGTSAAVFTRDFMTIYAGEDERLSPLRVQYKDFSIWQASKIGRKAIKHQEQYWLKLFEEEIPLLNLPWDHPRPLKRSYEGDNLEFEIEKEVTDALKQLANDKEATLFMVLISIYYVLLSKLSWCEDIVVGTPIAGRRQVQLHRIIGMFVNTLALRNYPSGEKIFKAFLEEVKKQFLEAFENQDYPFEDLVEKIASPREPSRNPLFDTLFTLQNLDIPGAEIPGLTLKPYDYNPPVSRFDMTWIGKEKEGTLCFTIEYCTKLFKEETIKRFGDYFKTIITAVLEDRNIQLKDIEISPGLTDQEETTYEEEAAGDFGF
ncbi:MAG: amino acid adenylation domain-containing protein, partial [Candidatus Aminicenantes bacterium]